LDALKDEPDSEESDGIAEINENRYSGNYKENPFSQQELQVAWKNFVANIDAPQLKSALSAREPGLTNKWLIEYELDTEIQLNRLTFDIKPKLLAFLRRLFENDAIEILFIISTDSGQRPGIPYTDSERWSLLVDKYPALSTLKSKFGLDFEHF